MSIKDNIKKLLDGVKVIQSGSTLEPEQPCPTKPPASDPVSESFLCSIDELITRLANKQPEFHIKRRLAAEYLGHKHAEKAEFDLIRIAEDKNDYLDIRLECVISMAKIGSDRCLIALEHIAGDVKDVYKIRYCAIQLITFYSGPKAVELLIRLLGKEKPGLLKDYIASRLSNYGDNPKVKQTLSDYMKGNAIKVRYKNGYEQT